MKKKRFSILLFVVLLLGLSACGKSGRDSSHNSNDKSVIDRLSEGRGDNWFGDEKTTVMIYMIGSDLESGFAAATDDMKEMEDSGVDPELVTVLVYTGGAESWHSDIPTDKNTVFRLTADGFQKETEFELMSMGDPDNLDRFLNYAWENFPADRFHLLFWDHGSGPVMGYGHDMLFDGDCITLPELRTALENSPFSKENKLGVIGFDACLMASVELACVTGDYAEYLVSSQEVEPSYGWNYALLEKCGKVSISDFTQEIVDTYMSYNEAAFHENEFFHCGVTLSVVDLSYADELREKVSGLFSVAKGDVDGDFNKLVGARVQTRALGRASTGSEYDLVDLGSLSEMMSDRYSEAASELRDVLNNAVIVSASNIENCSGLSIYFPYYNKEYYSAEWKKEYSAIGLFPEYQAFLEAYESHWMESDLKEFYKGKLVPLQGSAKTQFNLRLTEEQKESYAESRYYILKKVGEDMYRDVFLSANVKENNGLLTADFDGRILYVSNNSGEKHIPVTVMKDTVGDVTHYSILNSAVEREEETDALIGSWETESIEYQISVNTKSGECIINGIYSIEDDTEIISGKRKAINPSEWDNYLFLNGITRYLTRDENGTILSLSDWPKEDVISGWEPRVADGLYFTYDALVDDGSEYFLMFEIEDVQNNRYSSELFPIDFAYELTDPEVKETEVETIEWNSNNMEQTIYSRDGVEVKMVICKSVLDGDFTYGVEALNNGDTGVEVWFDSFGINDLVCGQENYFSIELEPGNKKYHVLGDVRGLCMYEGIMMPESIQLSLSLSKSSGETVFRNQRISIRLNKDMAIDYYSVPIKGAYADEQILLDDEVTITLLGMGCYFDHEWHGPESQFAELTVLCRVENKSGEEKKVFFSDAEINVGFSGYLSEAKFVTLNPGGTAYLQTTIDMSAVSSEETGERVDLETVNSISLQFSIDNKEYSLPVHLTH
ncbi:MAG: hypothetical protein IJM25_00600 [Eubacterium sp.]|nr:hypothetical protein [Eubacterium sp.]